MQTDIKQCVIAFSEDLTCEHDLFPVNIRHIFKQPTSTRKLPYRQLGYMTVSRNYHARTPSINPKLLEAQFIQYDARQRFHLTLSREPRFGHVSSNMVFTCAPKVSFAPISYEA